MPVLLRLELPGREGFRQIFCIPNSQELHVHNEASSMRLCLGAGRSSSLIPPGAVSFRPRPFPTTSRQHRAYASAVSAAELQFGQILHETHPHLLKAGERTIYLLSNKLLANGEVIVVTPGITAQEYAQRRSRLAASLPNDGVAILAAADVKYRSGAVFYDFHQDSNFFYLTGIVFLYSEDSQH